MKREEAAFGRTSNSESFREQALNVQLQTSNSEESAESVDETIFDGNPMFTEPQSIAYNLA